MSQFQFQTAARIISGLGSIQELKQIILENHYRKLLIITDAGMVQHQLHLPIIEILERLNITYSIYSNIQADPPEHIVLDAAEFAKKEKVDAILSFGGGSSMDVAKIIALLAHPEQRQTIAEMYGVNNAKILNCP